MPAPLATPRAIAAAADLPVQIIAPARGWVPIRLRELWEYRELLYFLIWREVKIRYKQAALGVAWAVLQPFLTMVIFSVVFGRFAGMPSDGLPYPVFAYCALLPWQLFTYSLTESSNSVVANQRLITKVYFPRVIMPIAAVGVGLLDFAISFIVLLCLMGFYGAYYDIAVGAGIWTVPLWTLLAVMTALGVGFWLSALNVKYRDIRYTVPFLAQLWFFATPVVYPTSIVPADWRFLFALNPMVGVVDGFRWALLGTTNAPAPTVLISIGAVCAIFVGGLFYFRRVERTFADVI
jgi:homopolymeric O-antigen transport system permease protein